MRTMFKNHRTRITLAFVCVLLCISLDARPSYAPVQLHERNGNEISRIKVTNPKDFSFAVFGDNKGNSSFFEPLIQDIDQDKGIAFAIDVGDLVNDGKTEQFHHFLNQVQRSTKIPFLTAIGNHDLSNNGSSNYRDVFGSTYYSFQVGQCSFFVLDATTEATFDKTERQWLENELSKAKGSRCRFVFMHVPLFDPRGSGFKKCFEERCRKDFSDLFKRYNVTHVFASHIHGYFSGVWEGIPYTITGGAGASLQGTDPGHFFHHYVKVHVDNGKVDLQVRRINRKNAVGTFYDRMCLLLYTLMKQLRFAR